MKCNHCNSEVADGTKFCPYCGNRIELPVSLRCPQCNTEVADGTKFCPNCGSPIGIPQPRKCSQCGAEIEDGEKFCSNCGSPIGGVSQSQMVNNVKQQTFQNPNREPIGGYQPQMAYNAQQWQQNNQYSNFSNSTLNFKWDCRKKLVMDKHIVVYVNNQRSVDFSPKEPFEKKYTITSPNFNMQVEYGFGPFSKTDIKLDLSPNQSYVCTCFLNTMGTCGYELTDSQGNLIKEDGNIGFWQFMLFILIPLFGFIYYFMKKSTQPLSAKLGLFMGFANLVFLLLRYIFNI